MRNSFTERELSRRLGLNVIEMRGDANGRQQLPLAPHVQTEVPMPDLKSHSVA